MNTRLYIKDAIRTDLDTEGYMNLIQDLGPSQLRLIHAALGIAGEAGEIVDIIKKGVIYDKPGTSDVLLKECGDLLWYMAIMLDEFGSDFETVMMMNIKKLKERYPKGFTKEAAIARKDLTCDQVSAIETNKQERINLTNEE